MRLEELDYYLPLDLIAQAPARPRDTSRLLVLHRSSGKIEDRIFSDVLGYVKASDIVVMNDTRVIPARLCAEIAESVIAVEVLLLREESDDTWQAMVKPGKKARDGVVLQFGEGLQGEIVGRTPEGNRNIRFSLHARNDGAPQTVKDALERIGVPPLPPYITAPLKEADDYQTVYARHPGSIAAPTAGLHFTPDLLARLQQTVKAVESLTLHIGPATFRPIRSEVVEGHPMPPERYTLTSETTDMINRTRADGGRLIAVGTSTCRVLESCVDENGIVHPAEGETSLFIQLGYRFKAVDVLLTNFHLPKSTNLLLAMAFAGEENVRNAYTHAVKEQYRFYSFGDAMLIV